MLVRLRRAVLPRSSPVVKHNQPVPFTFVPGALFLFRAALLRRAFAERWRGRRRAPPTSCWPATEQGTTSARGCPAPESVHGRAVRPGLGGGEGHSFARRRRGGGPPRGEGARSGACFFFDRQIKFTTGACINRFVFSCLTNRTCGTPISVTRRRFICVRPVGTVCIHDMRCIVRQLLFSSSSR